jgi:hypothetical protein
VSKLFQRISQEIMDYIMGSKKNKNSATKKKITIKVRYN